MTQHHAPEIPRFAVVGGCMGICHEHQSAIALLVGTGRAASAAALLRPALEHAGGAAWALYCADPQRIEALFSGRRDLPDLGRQARELEKVKYVTNLGLLELMNGQGEMLHKFTHASISQVQRRYSPDANAQSFTLAEQHGILALADIFSLLATAVYAATLIDESISDFLKAEMDGLVRELSGATLGIDRWDGWEALPTTRQPLGRTIKEIQLAGG